MSKKKNGGEVFVETFHQIYPVPTLLRSHDILDVQRISSPLT